MYFLLAFEEILPARQLRVFPVADLEPLAPSPASGVELVLCDDALEISLAGECEHRGPGSNELRPRLGKKIDIASAVAE